MGCYSEARDYGEQSLSAAEEAEDEVWQLNASVLIAQADGKSGRNMLCYVIGRKK